MATTTTNTEDMEKKLQTEPVVSPVDEPEKTTKPSGIFATIRYYEEYLDRKMGIESHSLDRVHPENRNSPSAVVMGLMWASATMNISCFSTGFLGNQFGLSLGQTIPIVIFATLLGAAVTVSVQLLILDPTRLVRWIRTNCLLSLLAYRVGVLLWAPELVCARSPFPDTHWASIHHPSSRC